MNANPIASNPVRMSSIRLTRARATPLTIANTRKPRTSSMTAAAQQTGGREHLRADANAGSDHGCADEDGFYGPRRRTDAEEPKHHSQLAEHAEQIVLGEPRPARWGQSARRRRFHRQSAGCAGGQRAPRGASPIRRPRREPARCSRQRRARVCYFWPVRRFRASHKFRNASSHAVFRFSFSPKLSHSRKQRFWSIHRMT